MMKLNQIKCPCCEHPISIPREGEQKLITEFYISYSTCTIRPPDREMCFNIKIDNQTLEKLSREKILYLTFTKDKYKFLMDLQDVIAVELLHKINEILEAEESGI